MTGARILLVEDEAITAKDLEARLTGLGYRVEAIVCSGEEAIDKAAATSPDLVLMDIRLKGAMDGVQAAAEIRVRFGIPVMYLTGFADEGTVARAQETAPYGYLVKPFDERELHASLQTALHRHRLEQQIEQASQLKADMIATVSHELRSSSADVVGLADLLLNGGFGPLTAEQNTHLQLMEDSLERMLEVIRSALDFSRLDSQGTLLDLCRTNVGDLVAELAREANTCPRRPEVQLAWEVGPELPAVRTDPVKLKIVIRNLIANALKYTEQGSVTVSVGAHQDGVEFLVRDTGVGIPQEAREVVFEPFRRLSGASGDVGGVGLGLYIARRLTEMLGGTIALDSTVRAGSTFRVWIPGKSAVADS